MALIVRNLSDQLVDIVRERIVSGEIAPDKPVRQDVLAAELGVSKIPIREALGRLERDGLLHSAANRGFFVAPMTREEAEEVFALRLKLEPEATAMASSVATESDHACAKRALSVLDRESSAHSATVGAANRNFHIALIVPGSRAVTAGILEKLHVLADRYVRAHIETKGRDARAKKEHEAIFRAWLMRDTTSVERLVRAHIDATLQDLRRELRA